MNTAMLTKTAEKFGVWILTLFFTISATAQETTTPNVDISTTSTTTTTTEEWYSNPIFWVIGALLLIVLIAVVARGNRRDA